MITILGFDRVTPFSVRVRANLGVPDSRVEAVQARYSRSSSMSSPTVEERNFATSVVTADNLTPATRYYFQVRYKDAQLGGAWVDWSPVAAINTPSVEPPKVTVTPEATGSVARAKVTPASNAAGVNRYHVIANASGAPALEYEGTNSTPSFTGMRPGVTYQWRARVRYEGGYWTEFGNPISVTQPKPNNNPGDYYDGSFPATSEESFAWAGTAHASQSILRAPGVEGWAHLGASGWDGSVALHRAVSSLQGGHAARVIFRSGSTVPGLYLGMDRNSPNGRATVIPDTRYTASIYWRASRAQRIYAQIVWMDATGLLISSSVSDHVYAATNSRVRLVISGIAPAGGVRASIRVVDVAGEGWVPWQSGDIIEVDGAMMTLGDLYDYFDGSTPDTDRFVFEWDGTEHASISRRLEIPPEEVDPLLDPDCEVIPAAPRPPSIPTECIIETDIWRRLTFQVYDGDVRLWATSVPIFTIKTGDAAERQIRIRIYANPDGVAPELVDMTEWDSELILTYLPPNVELTLDGISQRAYALTSPGEIRSAGHLLYGTDGAPATWPEMKCGIGYVITVDTPPENPASNFEISMSLARSA